MDININQKKLCDDIKELVADAATQPGFFVEDRVAIADFGNLQVHLVVTTDTVEFLTDHEDAYVSVKKGLSADTMDQMNDAEYYQHYLNEGLQELCNAVGVPAERYDRDQADGECYLDCFKEMAGALKKFNIRWDDESGDFYQCPFSSVLEKELRNDG